MRRKVKKLQELLLNSNSSKPSFINGFVFMFGLTENPYDAIIEEYLSSSVNDTLLKDWKQVGQDLRNAIE